MLAVEFRRPDSYLRLSPATALFFRFLHGGLCFARYFLSLRLALGRLYCINKLSLRFKRIFTRFTRCVRDLKVANRAEMHVKYWHVRRLCAFDVAHRQVVIFISLFLARSAKLWQCAAFLALSSARWETLKSNWNTRSHHCARTLEASNKLNIHLSQSCSVCTAERVASWYKRSSRSV